MNKEGAIDPTGGQAESQSALRSLRIVIAEDDRDTALSLTMILGDEGHDTRTVSSGRNVMGAVIDFDPDVVLLDINMPGLSGWEVARTIRSRRGNERPMIIGISGEYTQGADRILSEILGLNHYLVKPYDPKTLLALIAPLRLPRADPG
jgi:DNA-binding response OmpR family regulator